MARAINPLDDRDIDILLSGISEAHGEGVFLTPEQIAWTNHRDDERPLGRLARRVWWKSAGVPSVHICRALLMKIVSTEVNGRRLVYCPDGKYRGRFAVTSETVPPLGDESTKALRKLSKCLWGHWPDSKLWRRRCAEFNGLHPELCEHDPQNGHYHLTQRGFLLTSRGMPCFPA